MIKHARSILNNYSCWTKYSDILRLGNNSRSGVGI